MSLLFRPFLEKGHWGLFAAKTEKSRSTSAPDCDLCDTVKRRSQWARRVRQVEAESGLCGRTQHALRGEEHHPVLCADKTLLTTRETTSVWNPSSCSGPREEEKKLRFEGYLILFSFSLPGVSVFIPQGAALAARWFVMRLVCFCWLHGFKHWAFWTLQLGCSGGQTHLNPLHTRLSTHQEYSDEGKFTFKTPVLVYGNWNTSLKVHWLFFNIDGGLPYDDPGPEAIADSSHFPQYCPHSNDDYELYIGHFSPAWSLQIGFLGVRRPQLHRAPRTSAAFPRLIPQPLPGPWSARRRAFSARRALLLWCFFLRSPVGIPAVPQPRERASPRALLALPARGSRRRAWTHQTGGCG